jgi:tetratricopeptide (TPR) repeat protein
LHLKIGDEIERRSGNRLIEVAETLAHHYERSDNTRRAFRYLVMAGEKSLGVYSLDEAERYFERALALRETRPDCADEHAFTSLLADMSQLLIMKFVPGKLKRLVDRHWDRIASLGDLPQSVIIASNYSYAASMMCEFEVGERAADNALVMALRLNDDRCNAYARAAVIMSKIVVGHGSLEEMEHHSKLGALESDRAADPYLQNWIRIASAWSYLQRGLTDRGRERALELQERGRKMRDPRALATSLFLLGWLDITEEQYDSALAHGEECARTAVTPMDREIGLSVKGIAQIFRGEVRAGAELLREHRRRWQQMEWHYMTVGVDGPLGVATVLQGDFAAGVRIMEEAIERNARTGSDAARDFAGLFLAETYIEFLQPRQKPSLLIIFKNLPFLIRTTIGGWKKAVMLLERARENKMFVGDSHLRARIVADLGVLYKLAKRHKTARQHFEDARPIAQALEAKALLAKIDAGLAELEASV